MGPHCDYRRPIFAVLSYMDEDGQSAFVGLAEASAGPRSVALPA